MEGQGQRDDEGNIVDGGDEGLEVLGDEEHEEEEGVIDVEAEAQPARKRKVPAPVWEYGGEKTENGSKCLICGKEYKSEKKTAIGVCPLVHFRLLLSLSDLFI